MHTALRPLQMRLKLVLNIKFFVDKFLRISYYVTLQFLSFQKKKDYHELFT